MKCKENAANIIEQVLTIKDGQIFNLLHVAIIQGNLQMVKYLIEEV